MTDTGFDGTVTESEFAWMFALGGADAVADDAAWKVTAGTGRSVNVAGAGYAFARGVLSHGSGTLTVGLSTPTNGQWNLIVRRINWSANTVTVLALPHTTTSTTAPNASQQPTTVPAALQSTAGTTYDHILAWAWVNSVNTTVTVFDLRQLPAFDRYTGRLNSGRNAAAYVGADVQSFSATNVFTNQPSFAPFPIAADAAALQKSFTKTSPSSRLRAFVSATGQLSSGVAQNAYIGLRVNGADYQVATRRFNDATDRETLVGNTFITGVAAGTFNVLPVFRGGPASVYEFFSDDMVSWSLEEVG